MQSEINKFQQTSILALEILLDIEKIQAERLLTENYRSEKPIEHC